jgi:hypothetical protein
MNPRVETDCWPTAEQELLLRAALLRGEAALAAWEKWRSNVDPDRLDAASYRLLPQLYKNLQAHGVREPLVDKLKGVYRLTWYKNQIAFRRLAALLRSLHDLGIDTLVLKGVPLVLLYYRDYGLRPMADFDVLVQTKDALPAFRFLSSSGWTAVSPESFRETDLSVRHGVNLRDPAGQQFDLHWHLLPECCRPEADRDLWKNAVPLTIDQVPTHTLNSTDHLLHVCAHGVRWDPVPPFRWIADAMAIMNRSISEIEWERLLAQAETRGLIYPLKEALSYLRETFDAPVPAEVLRHMREIPTSDTERIEHRYRTQNYQNKLLGRLPLLWFNYLRSAGAGGSRYKLIGFMNYLQRFWGVDHLWQAVLYAALKSVRGIWRTLAWRGSRWMKNPAARR